MAWQSQSACTPESQQAAATDNVEAHPAQAAAPAELEPADVYTQQKPASQEQQAVSLLTMPHDAQQSAPSLLTQTQPEQPMSSTLTPGLNTEDSKQEATASDEAKSDAGIPSVLGVVCADVQGLLTLDFKKMRCFIQYKGQEMSGTEFEKAAGREKAKKWKTSVRIAPVNGKQGEMVGDWLQRHGLDVRMSQLFKLGEARPATVRPPAAPRPPAGPRPSAPKPPPPSSTATLASASETEILEHLDKQYIGLQQGDPDMTFDRLPTGQAVPDMESGITLLDLRTVSYQQLMDLSAASAPDPFGELLPFNPGVLPARLGYMTGQQPKRHKARDVAPDPDKARLLMRQYLGGGIPSPPWESMGLSRPPVIAGRELDLRKLHEAIQECGGFEAAVSNKKFARIAIKLGIDLAVATNAAYLLKSHYQRLLAPYLQEAETAADAQQPAAVAQSEQRGDAMQIDSDSAERDGSMPADSADIHEGDRAGLADSTIQQHSAVLTARLQSQPDQANLFEPSDSEDADQTLPVPVDFKSTLVDASGPIPGLEDL